jgi:hypothetical protein
MMWDVLEVGSGLAGIYFLFQGNILMAIFCICVLMPAVGMYSFRK